MNLCAKQPNRKMYIIIIIMCLQEYSFVEVANRRSEKKIDKPLSNQCVDRPTTSYY